MNVLIIIASTRPGRIGGEIGAWITRIAQAQPDFTVSVADLKVINLPIFDEPSHPMQGTYEKDHTKAWSKTVDQADAFVIVTPEYNYTIPPALLNAIDYLHHEWKYKPVAYVGYGGTGAVRAIQTIKLMLSGLSVVSVPLAVNLMGTYAPLDGEFAPDARQEQTAQAMLNELKLWATALLPLHTKP